MHLYCQSTSVKFNKEETLRSKHKPASQGEARKRKGNPRLTRQEREVAKHGGADL